MSRASGARLAFLFDTLAREQRHLLLTTRRLFVAPIDAQWVAGLEDDPDLAERLDAFVVRFGRMQDTLGDKLVPELLRQSLEPTGSVLDNLQRMEKLGLLASALDWAEVRSLRNRLVHEYMRDAQEFAQALVRAREAIPLLVDTHQSCRRYASERGFIGG